MDDAFACHRCGTCCTNLKEAWDGNKGTVASLPDDRIHRLPQPGGLRLFAWEASRFPSEDLSPLLVVPDAKRERLIALAYELDENRCPNYDDAQGCTIYEDRPLVCQAYPLLVVQGKKGPQLTVSAECPARLEPLDAGEAEEDPVEAIARAYPDEIAPALAVPAILTVLTPALDLLETAGAIEPRRGLTDDELAAWRDDGPVDLVDLAEKAGIFTASILTERVERIKDRLRKQKLPEDAPA